MALIDSLISEYKAKQRKKSQLRKEINALKAYEEEFKGKADEIKINAATVEDSFEDIKWAGETRASIDWICDQLFSKCKKKKTGLKTTLDGINDDITSLEYQMSTINLFDLECQLNGLDALWRDLL